MGPMLGHNERALRHTAGSGIAAMVVACGVAQWPELITQLHQCLASSNAAAVDGGLDTLYKARCLHSALTWA